MEISGLKVQKQTAQGRVGHSIRAGASPTRRFDDTGSETEMQVVCIGDFAQCKNHREKMRSKIYISKKELAAVAFAIGYIKDTYQVLKDKDKEAKIILLKNLKELRNIKRKHDKKTQKTPHENNT